MKIKARQLADIIKGEIAGNPDISVNNIAKIEEAGKDDLTFLSNKKYEGYLSQTAASIIIISRELMNDHTPLAEDRTYIIVADAHVAFNTLLQFYQKLVHGEAPKTGIHPSAVIESAHPIPDTCYIGPFVHIQEGVIIGEHTLINSHAVIERNSVIGSHCQINAGVKVHYNCQIGHHVIIHANVVIGGDGFGFQPNAAGEYSKVPQMGNVIIEDDVEIGANSTIDRATLGSTVIRKGVKIDNLVQIAHNVVIGEHTVIAAQAGVSGSTKIGRNCVIGGQVGIVGHITISDYTQINAQSGVSKSIKEKNSKITGSPAFDYNAALRSQVIFRQLPEIKKDIEALKRKLK